MTIRVSGKQLGKSSGRSDLKRSGYAKPKLIPGFEGAPEENFRGVRRDSVRDT
jgi:hypothetical protein